MDQKRIGAFIAQCRREKNLTQMQLAGLLGITSQAVSKWQNGRGMPDVSLLQPLCGILGVSLNELFSGEYMPVKYLFSMCAKATLFVVICEVVIGLVGNFFYESILEIMLWNALVWLLLFVISISKITYDKKKLTTLKHSGVCVESQIKELIPASWIRIGNYNSCRVVCKYVFEGKEYKAVSNYYVLPPFLRIEDLYANVYVENNNPDNYGIELFQTG